MAAVADKSWQREFEDPIPLPDGTQLKTLREAHLIFGQIHPQGGSANAGSSDSSANAYLRGRTRERPDVFRAHRYASGHPPQRGAGVQSRPERPSLGKAKAEEGSVNRAIR